MGGHDRRLDENDAEMARKARAPCRYAPARARTDAGARQTGGGE
jgi:hypothetical protein